MKTALTLVPVIALLGCATQQQTEPATPPVEVQATRGDPAPPVQDTAQLGPAHVGFAGLMDQAVTSFGAVATPTHLYTLGGYSGTPHHYVKEHQSSRFARMDLSTGDWEDLQSPGRSQGATISAFQDKLYRVGGMRIENADGEDTNLQSLDSFAVYDTRSGVWTALPSLPEPRSSHESAFIGSELYVVGGWQLQGAMDSGQWHQHMVVADVSQNPIVWRKVELPFKRRALGVAAMNQHLVVIGGMETYATRDDVFIYDTVAGTWSAGPKYPERGFGLRAATLGGRVYASAASGIVRRLSDDRSAWEDVATLAFGRFFHQVAPTGDGSMLFVGGIPAHGTGSRIRHVERLSFGSSSPPRVNTWTVDSPMASKNRQGMFIHGNRMYLFGGNNSLGQHDFAQENFVAEGHRFDLGALEWKPLGQFPRNRQSMQTLVTTDGRGLAIGGFGMNEAGALRTQQELFEYDFKEDTWKQLEKGLPESRTQFGLTQHEDSLFIFGGLDFDDQKKGQEQFVHPQSVLVADVNQLNSGFSDSGISLPRPRRAFGSALLDGKYYLVGGMAAGFSLVDECDVFDFASKTWQTIPAPATTRIGAEVVALNGKLFLIAGRSKNPETGKLGPNDSIEVYSPQTGQWSVWVEKLPFEDTHQLRAFPFRDKLALFSSQRKDGKVQVVLVETK